MHILIQIWDIFIDLILSNWKLYLSVPINRKMKTTLLVFFCCSFFSIANAQHDHIDSLLVVLQHSKNDIDKAQTYNAVADVYKTSNPRLMIDYATKALVLSQKIQYKIEEGNAHLNLGNANIILGNYSKALAFLLMLPRAVYGFWRENNFFFQ